MRWLRRALVVAGVMLVFVVALVAGAALHIGLPAARRTLVDSLNGLLDDAVDGTIVIRGIDALSPSGASGIRAEVLDPQGRRAVLANGVSAEWSAREAIAGALFGDTIPVARVRVAHAELSLDEDGARLARSFATAPSPAEAAAPKRPLHVDIAAIAIDHVWVHGTAGGAHVDAEVDDVSAGLHVETTTGDLRIDLAHARIWTRAAPYDLDLAAQLRGHLVLGDAGTAGEATLRGSIAGAPIDLDGSYRREGVALHLAAGPIAPQAMARRLGWAPETPATVSLTARGPLEAVDTALAVRLATPDGPPASLDWRGSVDTGAPGLRGRLDVGDLDLRALAAGAPRSRIDARADVTLSLEAGRARGDADLRLGRGSRVDGRALPDASVRARLRDERIDVEADVAGRGIRAHATARIAARDAGTSIAGTVAVPALDLRALPLPVDVTGRGRLEADIDARFGGGRSHIDARARGVWQALAFGPVAAAHTAFDAGVRGAWPAPELWGEARIDGLRTPAGAFRQARVSARGSTAALAVEAGVRGGDGALRALDAAADVSLRKGVSIEDARADADTRGGPLRARVARVAVGDGIDIRDLSIDGAAGRVAGSLSTAPGRERIDVQGSALDLERIGRILGLPELAGRARFDVDVGRRGRGLHGELRASFEDAALLVWDDVGGRLHASLDGGDLALRAAVRAGGAAVIEVDADVSTDRPWQSAAALRRLTGQARLVAAADLTAAETIAQALGTTLPLELHGDLATSITLRRDDPTRAPAVAVALSGERLGAQPQATQFLSRLEGDDALRWRVRGLVMDVLADVSAQGDADLELRLRDRHGRLLALDATADVPYAALWRDGLAGSRASEWLARVPVKLWAHTDRRSLSRLADLVDADDLDGEMQLEAWFDGTLHDPRAKLSAQLFDARGELSPFDVPIDANLLGTWDGEMVDARLALADPERKIAVAHVRADADVPAAIRGVTLSRPWRADAHIELCRFPLHAVSMVAGLSVEGRVDGGLEIDGLHTPEVRGTAGLSVTDLRVGEARYRGAALAARVDQRQLDAEAVITQQAGGAELRAQLPVVWQGGVPALGDGGGRVALTADDLRLAIVQPFVEETVPELDGLVDGEVTLRLDTAPEVSGSLKVTRGRAQLAAFGDTFTDIQALFSMRPNGRIETALRAKSGGGWVVGRGRAVVQGPARMAANIALRVDEDAPIPVLVEGRYIGELGGDVNASLQLGDDRLVVEARVPELLLELPRRTSDDVEDLEPAPHVRIGTVGAQGFVPLLLSPPEPEATGPGMATLVRVRLGDEVRVVRGDELEVWLGGAVALEVTDVMRAAGTIEVTSGEIDLQGKTFEIQKATVTFDGRPPIDPQIVATAAWQSPDGITVYADYIGPVSNGKVALRSDPPMDDSRILALLAFGDADYQFQSEQTEGGVGTAIGVGGSLAAQGLNEALNDLTSLDLTARVDTSRTTAATELEWRIARQFAVSVAHVVGIPPPGEPPDKNYATIDWTFAHEWSLETAVGDRGSTTVDVIWSHAY